MLARTELDLKITEYQSLTPEGRALLRDQAVAKARIERAKAVRAIFAALVAWVAGRWAAFRRWREIRTAVAELHTFDDRQLKDIGLRRSEIVGAVHGYNRDDSLRSRGGDARKPELTLHRSSCNDNEQAAKRKTASGAIKSAA